MLLAGGSVNSTTRLTDRLGGVADVHVRRNDFLRVFLGVKQTLGRSWSFDLGYMLLYQQKASGYPYDLNHTLRWFFYFTPDLRKVKSSHHPASGEE